MGGRLSRPSAELLNLQRRVRPIIQRMVEYPRVTQNLSPGLSGNKQFLNIVPFTLAVSLLSASLCH